MQEDKGDYGKLEEALRKGNLSDLKSGIATASKLIDHHVMNTELYLLRAKLSLKTVRQDNLMCDVYLSHFLVSYQPVS